MIVEFVDFCRELFPSISPYTTDEAKKALRQFERVRGFHQYTISPLDFLSQGDIFSSIPFRYIDKHGDLKTMRAQAQLLSNTCDSERTKTLLFAAVLPIDEFSDNAHDITILKNNKYFKMLYLPDNVTNGLFTDLSIVNSISREFFNEQIESNRITKIASLSCLGFYFFMCKLTVFLMRPEDSDVNFMRDFIK